MLGIIQKLLVLQDRDRKILRLRAELATVEPERLILLERAGEARQHLEATRLRSHQLETERKRLEVEVEGKKQLIEKYSIQQFQTKKNEEYRALAHEIETCREAIRKLDDAQLDLMEQLEVVQREALEVSRQSQETQAAVERQVAELGERDKNLRQDVTGLEADRDRLAQDIEEAMLARYERLLKHKGGTVLVGVEHGVCGGCHMRLPVQILVLCRGEKEMVTCPNCGRILYYTRDMDIAVAD